LATESTALTTSNRLFLRRLLTQCLTLCLLVAVPLASQANDKEATRKANSGKKPVAQQSAKANTKTAAKSTSKPSAKVRKVAKNNATEPRASFGRVAGLHQSSDELDLRSSVALVIDQDTH
jgi:D-alanyl-D-alanine endopeptidase (penicillin-binding protein 7)